MGFYSTDGVLRGDAARSGFDVRCVDWPILKALHYRDAKPPPPLFRYCADDSTLDIPFPDWSFWGLFEINRRPWEGLLKDILKGHQEDQMGEQRSHGLLERQSFCCRY